MVATICKQKKLPLINIVRKQEQVDILEELGQELIVNTSEEDWKNKLDMMIRKTKPTYAIDCVAGELPGVLLSMMPQKAVVAVFGSLSRQDLCEIDPFVLKEREQSIEAFFMGKFLLSKPLLGKINFIGRV